MGYADVLPVEFFKHKFKWNPRLVGLMEHVTDRKVVVFLFLFVVEKAFESPVSVS